MHDKDSLEAELVQVAAVAVAWLEDLGNNRYETYKAISDERVRQINKWGEQHHPAEKWSAILGEEYGEACKALLKAVDPR